MSPESSRLRLLEAALRLFGEQGYAATTVAQIEAAAGLSPGAGGLYAHFPSKLALLRACLDAVLIPAEELSARMATAEHRRTSRGQARPGQAVALDELFVELHAIAVAGLARLRHDRDLNRILIRDLRAEPEMLQLVADRELRPVHHQLVDVLARQLPENPAIDPAALAAVLIGAISHYWLLADVFGSHPSGVSEDDYLRTAAQIAALALTGQAV